jgi:hypothetical protein
MLGVNLILMLVPWERKWLSKTHFHSEDREQ